MLVIFATRTDPEARSLAERWAAHDAAVLTCEDLSAAGWRHHLPRRAAGSAVVGGRTIPTAEIAGVLTRWPSVFEQELGQIAAERRSYVASEMTAFLRSWLTDLDCPVVNRPSAASLIGPNWRPEQWVHAAAGLGIPVRPVRRLVRLSGAAEPAPAPQEAPYTTVTVVGEAVFGTADPALARHARRLAAAAGVELLAVHWSGPESDAKLLSADLLPPLGDGAVADALLELLLDRRPGRRAAAGGRA